MHKTAFNPPPTLFFLNTNTKISINFVSKEHSATLTDGNWGDFVEVKYVVFFNYRDAKI